MFAIQSAVIANLVVAGVSFKKTDVAVRGKFAFTPEQSIGLYRDSRGSDSFFILSTCNRTEVYGVVSTPTVASGFLYDHAGLDEAVAADLVYVKCGYDAARHLFRVASGLDSQIPGDYEIVSQLKTAFRLSRENGRASGYLEKLLNFALQASKEVKRSTAFSDGTLSVPFTVAKEIGESRATCATVLGAGATARLVVNAIKNVCPGMRVNVVNRTKERIQSLVDELGVIPYRHDELHLALEGSEALVIATNALEPLVFPNQLAGTTVRVVYDLAVPRNAAPELYGSTTLRVIDVDELSHQVNAVIRKREKEAVEAEAIVERTIAELRSWDNRREFFAAASQAGNGAALSSKQIHESFREWETGVKPEETIHDAVRRTFRENAA